LRNFKAVTNRFNISSGK